MDGHLGGVRPFTESKFAPTPLLWNSSMYSEDLSHTVGIKFMLSDSGLQIWSEQNASYVL